MRRSNDQKKKLKIQWSRKKKDKVMWQDREMGEEKNNNESSKTHRNSVLDIPITVKKISTK
jgi:hypothetical protein